MRCKLAWLLIFFILLSLNTNYKVAKASDDVEPFFIENSTVKSKTSSNYYRTDSDATKAVDDNVATFWHSDTGMSQNVVFDLGKTYTLQKLISQSRAMDSVYDYSVSVSNDGVNFISAAKGTLTYESATDETPKDIYFKKPMKAQYVKYECLRAKRPYFVLSEVNFVAIKDVQDKIEMPKDIIGVPSEKAVKLLFKLGITFANAENNFEPQKLISRAEFLAMVLKITGNDYAIKSTQLKILFNDVPTRYWANKEINYAVELGWINGDGQGNFHPDSAISATEATKLLVMALNYNMIAKSQGGYPVGYMSVAKNLKLLNGIDSSDYESLSKGVASRIIYNALFSKVLETSKISLDGSMTYTESNDTLLNKIFKLKYVVGTITGNYYTGIGGVLASDVDTVFIDGVKYKKGATDADKYVGYKMECVYQTDENANVDTLIDINVYKSNDVVKIEAKDIKAGDFQKIEYYNQEKKATIYLNDNATILVNGKPLNVWTETTFKPLLGFITASDTDGDGKYDFVQVNKIETYVIDSVIPTDDKINVKGGAPIILGDNLGNNRFAVFVDGELGDISDLAPWDVITVSRSWDNSNIIVNKTLSFGSITGTATSIDDENVTIDNKSYPISKSFYGTQIEVGFTGKFLFDNLGNVVATRESDSSKVKYGYIINAALETGVDNKLSIKLFNIDSKIVVYTVADKITLNGKTGQKTADVLTELVAGNDKIHVKDKSNIYEQLVTYNLNDKNEINLLNTALTTTPTESKGQSLVLGNTFPNASIISSSTSAKYYNNKFTNSSKLTGKNILISSATKILMVPVDKTKEEKFKFTNQSYFTGNTLYSGLYAFNDQGMNTPDILVCYIYSGSDAPIKAEFEYALVDKVVKVQDVKEDETSKIYLYYKGLYSSYTVRNSIKATAEAIGRGDVIMVGIDTDGYIAKILPVEKNGTAVDATHAIRMGKNDDGSDNGDAEFIYTYIENVDADKGYLMIKNNVDVATGVAPIGTSTYNTYRISGNLYIYDSEYDNVRIGSSTEIQQGDKVAIKTMYNNIQTIIILR